MESRAVSKGEPRNRIFPVNCGSNHDRYCKGKMESLCLRSATGI